MLNKCPADFEARILALRQKTGNRYGAEKLLERFAIKGYGGSCLKRIIRQHGLKRERPGQRNGDISGASRDYIRLL
jgi:hypothetical protein